MTETPKTPPNQRLPDAPFGYQPVEFDQNTRCPSLEETKRKKEIWLIKVPFDFDASCLTGQTIVMNGIQEISNSTSKENNDRFEILSKPLDTSMPSSFKALLPSSNEQSVWTAKHFKGSISMVKSLSVPIQDINLTPEHQSHMEAPEIKTRWKPFGYKQPFKAPVKSQEEEVQIKTEKQSLEDMQRKGKMDKKRDKKKVELPNKQSNEIFDENINIKVEKPSPEKDRDIPLSNPREIRFSTEEVKIKVEKNVGTPKKKRKKGK